MPDRLRSTGPSPADGFSLTEVLVAMVLFGVLLASVFLALGSMLGHARNNQDRTVAATIATRMIDRLHAIPAAQLPTGALPPQTVTSGGTSFTVNGAISLVSNGSASAASPCAGGGALSVKSLHVEVTWSGMRSTRPVVSDTLRQLTVADLDLTKGNLNTVVSDRNGDGVAGRTVTLSPRGLSTTTDADGCAVFSLVPAGTYTVAIAASPGWVDPSGADSPSHGVTITGGSVTRDVGFSLDRAATLTTSWTASTFPVLPGTGITVSQGAFTGGTRPYPLCAAVPYCSTPVQAGTTLTGTTTARLFPFPSGYRVWSGACTDAAPSSQPAAVVLPAGGTNSPAAQLPLARVTVTVQTSGGTPVANQPVLVTHPSDAACPAVSQTVAATGGSTSVPVGLPTGTWSFSSGGGAVVTVPVQAGAATTVVVRQR